jgi:hypothetical protein
MDIMEIAPQEIASAFRIKPLRDALRISYQSFVISLIGNGIAPAA